MMTTNAPSLQSLLDKDWSYELDEDMVAYNYQDTDDWVQAPGQSIPANGDPYKYFNKSESQDFSCPVSFGSSHDYTNDDINQL